MPFAGHLLFLMSLVRAWRRSFHRRTAALLAVRREKTSTRASSLPLAEAKLQQMRKLERLRIIPDLSPYQASDDRLLTGARPADCVT